MDRNIRNIAIAVASVLVVFIIAGALFLYGDSDIALLFAIVGVPAIIAIASVWYIKSVKQRRLEDPATRVKERELRSICRNVIQLRNRMHGIEDTHSITIPESIKEMDAIESAIDGSGGSIDPDSQSIDCDQDVIKGVTLFAIRNIAQDLDQTKQRFIDRLYDAAIKNTDDTRAKFETLNDAGYDLRSHISELESLMQPNKNLEEIVSYLDHLKIIAEDALRGCVDDAKKLATYQTGDISTAQVEDALRKQDYEGVVSTLEQDITTLKTATKEEFQTYRNLLIDALDVAIGAIDDKKFIEFKEEALGASSPEKLVQLGEIGDAFMEDCQKIVDQMHAELSSTEDRIKEFVPPDYFWKESGLAEKEYTLDKKDVLDAAGSFVSMLSELVPALDTDRRSYKILNSYHRTIERQIRKQLIAHGMVSEDDLKVAHPADFLHLYDYYHPDASYSDRILRLAEGAKMIENPLTINITDADENRIEGAKITLMHETGIGVTLNYITGEDGSVMIENPGEGTYRLVVDAAQYRKHESTTVLPADNIDIKLEQMGIKDYLCREKAQSIKDNLSRYASDVLKELNKSGVVSSEFEMYINKDYRACLLYILAEEHPNLRFVSSDSEYIVYDEEKMVSRLIERVKTMEKDEYAISDLDIPLPDEEILHLAEMAEKQGIRINIT
ncbi:MAG: carboxypeptidase-like regulatory domain-containing protein [Euryarchaeota archaeon]|nr:carboxypeptidase-like regulatory domain-containing protein [Euryarchaeota archaeon]